MGVSIDNGGVMHDVDVVSAANITTASAARAVDLLASIDVNHSDTLDSPGYTTPPPPSHAPAKNRAMHTSYSDISDDGNDTVLGSHEVIDKATRPLMTAAMLQRSNAVLKRVHTEHTDTVSNI